MAQNIVENAVAGNAAVKNAVVESAKVWRFGPNIDTDLIIAARYLNTSDGKALAKHVMEDARSEFAGEVKPGDCIVAGENFGCGSSREHAPLALKEAGISVVIAPYFARIFYRNAFNMGLLILECASVEKMAENDRISVDLEAGEIINLTKNERYKFNKIPPFMMDLLSSGGLLAHAKNKLGA